MRFCLLKEKVLLDFHTETNWEAILFRCSEGISIWIFLWLPLDIQLNRTTYCVNPKLSGFRRILQFLSNRLSTSSLCNKNWKTNFSEASFVNRKSYTLELNLRCIGTLHQVKRKSLSNDFYFSVAVTDGRVFWKVLSPETCKASSFSLIGFFLAKSRFLFWKMSLKNPQT